MGFNSAFKGLILFCRKEYSLAWTLLTYSTEQSPWEADRFSASKKKIPRILWNPKIHNSVHKCLPTLSWASSIQSIPPHPTSWTSILILSSQLRLGLPSGLFPSDFPTKTLHTPLLSLIRATCLAHRIRLDFITGIILGEEYRLLSSSLCSFLHSLVTSSLLGPNIYKYILYSQKKCIYCSMYYIYIYMYIYNMIVQKEYFCAVTDEMNTLRQRL